MSADTKHVLARLRKDESGFGLIELLMSLTILNIGLLATVAALNSGTVGLSRASRVSTATALADAQMERFRAVRFAAIGLNASLLGTDSAALYYASDTAYSGALVTGCATTDPTCDPVRTYNGASTPASPDGRSYRVDTYITQEAPTGTTTSRTVKKVTVVVREVNNLGKALVRAQSTFDESTGM